MRIVAVLVGTVLVMGGARAYQLTTCMVPMRDSIYLATDVFTPDTGGPRWPILLLRTPYNRLYYRLAGTQLSEIVDRRQYVVVTQDTRGRFASPGVDSVFRDDAWGAKQDGYDAIEWLARQDFSDGKVGTFGGSALGIVQYLAAGAVPPHLVCAFVEVAASSQYHHTCFPGGEFRNFDITNWLDNQGSSYMLDFFTAHPDYDAEWAGVDLATRYDRVRIPIYHVGGWYDFFAQGPLDCFAGLDRRGGPGARGRQKLLMGPWTHGTVYGRAAGQLTYPANAASYSSLTEMLRWSDYWLKGIENGVLDEPRVRFYLMGDPAHSDSTWNCWRTCATWPPPARADRYYLKDGGVLDTLPPSGLGAFAPFQADPGNPVPTLGGTNLLLAAGPYDQRVVENRGEMLIFTSAPLVRPLTVIGNIRCRLFASSSGRDTDWSVRLCDVYPDGRSMLVQDGILMARHRLGFDREDLLTPDSVYEFDIDLWSTALVFAPGHRIRVDITSSNSPRFDVNPNTGDRFRSSPGGVVVTNRVCFDADHPSCIILPVEVAHDVACQAIVEPPPGTTEISASFAPAVLIGNQGRRDEGGFPVECRIVNLSGGGTVYYQAAAVAGLAAGDSLTAAFPVWDLAGVPSADYQIRFITRLAGDENRANDTVVSSPFRVVSSGVRENDWPAPPFGLQLRHQGTGLEARLTVPPGSRYRPSVYDALGRCTARLGAGLSTSGRERIFWDGPGAPSGVYFVRLCAGMRSRTEKTVLRPD